MITILYFVAIIIGFASSAHAFHCHVCTSLLSSDCGDPFEAKNKYDTNCKLFYPLQTLTGCLKFKVTLDGETLIFRSCYTGGNAEYLETCKTNASTLEGTKADLKCELCRKELCNSSTSTGLYAATVICLILIVRMMSYFLSQ